MSGSIVLTQEQQAAADTMRRSRISLLTGGPGVGKTTTFSQVARDFEPHTTYCCAPTGRAAQRMTEALSESGLSLSAKTVHSTLVPQRGGGKGSWGFMYNSSNKLPAKVLIADECSMMDNQLFASLMSSLRPECKVIIIGDPDQLPPVGVGAALRDMIRSQVVPHARLTQVHRFAGRIAHVCRQINTGKRWLPSPALDDSMTAGEFGPENLKHMERKIPIDCITAMEQTILRLVERRGYSALNDIQVLCSRNDAGALSRTALNVRLQNLLNPSGEAVEGCPFRIGDKMMCLLNKWRESFCSEGLDKQGSVYVANGEIGICVQITKKDLMIRFGQTNVKFPRGSWKGELTLAYAITVWKAQGGGWPVCIHMIDDARNVDRSVVYTSISRSRKLCFTIGRKYTMDQQCEKILLQERKTFLSEKLRSRMEFCDGI